MIRVLIVCSWGMSTSLLVDSMLEAAKELKYEVSVEALSAGEYAGQIDECDIVLIAPRFAIYAKVLRNWLHRQANQ